MQKRRVDNIAVTDHPADVGGRPVHLAGLDPIEVLHRPLERDHVPAIVAHHPLGLPGGTRRVEDVERVGGGDRDTVVDRAREHDRFIAQARPVMVAAGNELGRLARPLHR